MPLTAFFPNTIQRPHRTTRAERAAHHACIAKHYGVGSSHGQSAAGTIYILATMLERVDNDLLWCVPPPLPTRIQIDCGTRLAILGLTYQYTTSRISRATYDKYHSIYYDEVFRLNPPLPHATTNPTAINPDDVSLRATEELRFMLFRHWTLYDAMYHSSYVAGKLGIWKERGRKRLTGLLAKMGCVLHPHPICSDSHPYSQILDSPNATALLSHGHRPQIHPPL